MTALCLVVWTPWRGTRTLRDGDPNGYLRPPRSSVSPLNKPDKNLVGRRGVSPHSRANPARMSSRQELVGLLFALPFGAANDAVRTD